MTSARRRLRRAAIAPLRPVVRFFDVRFQYLEDRFPLLEGRLATDSETLIELYGLIDRRLAGVEARLTALETALETGLGSPARGGDGEE